MKKQYLNPQTEMLLVRSANLMEASSPGFQITGDVITGNGGTEDPGGAL